MREVWRDKEKSRERKSVIYDLFWAHCGRPHSSPQERRNLIPANCRHIAGTLIRSFLLDPISEFSAALTPQATIISGVNINLCYKSH